jgi:NADH-quinone oxidoreductase subunit J
MLLLNAEFLAMLLIIVYVGAIAVLFLFVVMMLQTKYQHKSSKLQTAAAFFIATIVFVQIFSFLTLKTGKEENMIITNIPLVQISQTLYIENFMNFQVVGLILLIAMIAVILLTHMKSSTLVHKQDISKQVLRTKEESIVITKPESGKGIVL